MIQSAARCLCGDAPLSVYNPENSFIFRSRKVFNGFLAKKKGRLVSLGLSRGAEKRTTEVQPESKTETEATPSAAEPAENPVRSPWQTSVLGLNLSIEDLQAQEAALEQEFSARFRRAVAATRESLSEKIDTVSPAQRRSTQLCSTNSRKL